MKRLLLMSAAALVLSACSYTEVEREVGYKGKARINPWLAADRFAGRLDRETRSVISWTAPNWDDAVWVMPASILSNTSFVRQSEEWMRDGGHLILLVEYADAEMNDWSENHVRPVLEPALSSMLERAEFHLDWHAKATADSIKFEDTTFKVDANSEFAVHVRGGEGSVFGSEAVGEGRLTVVTDARIFRNRWIGEHEHAALLAALIESTDYQGAVGFMRGSGLSLWALLRQHLWRVLLGLGLWIVLWLWKNLARFGPIEAASVPPVLRGYEHHLEALGDFQWRLDRASSLLAPLREQIVELGQQTSVRAGRRDEDFFQFLADRAGLPRERVFRALAEAAPADPAVLTRTTADLQQLLKVLHHPALS
jgi:hypothetical protein